MMSYYVTMFGEVSGFAIVQNMCMMLLVFLYAYAVIAIWNQCMALTYLIPDQVLKWIGGAGGDMEMTKQFMSQVKGGMAQSSIRNTTPGKTEGTTTKAKTGSKNVKSRTKARQKAFDRAQRRRGK